MKVEMGMAPYLLLYLCNLNVVAASEGKCPSCACACVGERRTAANVGGPARAGKRRRGSTRAGQSVFGVQTEDVSRGTAHAAWAAR